jgi:uncharacterized protein (TIGR02266 family)
MLPVRLRPTADGAAGAWTTAETRNVGVGGAFVATPAAFEVGAALTLELTLPAATRVFTLPAVVRWRREVGDPDDGIGLQFVGVDVDVLLELNDFFASLTPPSADLGAPTRPR